MLNMIGENLILYVIGGYVLALAVAVVIILKDKNKPVCPKCYTDPCECD